MKFKFSASDVVAQKRTTHENISLIKKWLRAADEKYVPSSLSDEFIVLFLLSCNNDIEMTKKTVNAYYRLRKEAPELFDDRTSEREDIKKALNTLRLISIPNRTEENNQVIYCSIKDTDSKNFELHPIMKASLMLIDIEQHTSPPDGVIFLADMKGLGFFHVFKLNPISLKKYFTYLGEGVPTQFKGMHFMNGNYFLDQMMNILKAFINPDVINRLHIHSAGWNPEELFPKKCLPKELAGDLESEDVLSETTLQLFKDREDFWKAEEELRKSALK
ncbi:alpha-tocopherol transfer protein-like [Diabrotica undecimpunctata]|uniref:alpha-tocopherol transfer protein-like n=1 Tax=Diabrotica undecimpunctata TaxID=50387 RepID=UPI003B634C98